MKGLAGKVAIVPARQRSDVERWLQAARRGAEVMVADIADPGAGFGEGVAFQSCDLRDDAQIAALVTATKERFGRIDFLVNVACTYLDNGAA